MFVRTYKLVANDIMQIFFPNKPSFFARDSNREKLGLLRRVCWQKRSQFDIHPKNNMLASKILSKQQSKSISNEINEFIECTLKKM